jgi:hypothetical protein
MGLVAIQHGSSEIARCSRALRRAHAAATKAHNASSRAQGSKRLIESCSDSEFKEQVYELALRAREEMNACQDAERRAEQKASRKRGRETEAASEDAERCATRSCMYAQQAARAAFLAMRADTNKSGSKC